LIGLGIVLILLYLAGLESRLAQKVTGKDLESLYEASKNLSFLRTQIADVDARLEKLVRAVGENGRGASGGRSVPIGAVVPFAGPAAKIPAGWLLCDGASYPRAGVYAKLFAAIGNTYGAGDGSDTFRVPDYRGLFLRGVDDPDGPGGNEPAGRDPQAAERIQMETGDLAGDVVGSLQGDATRAPNSPFITLEGGAHSHSVMWSREGGGGMDDVRHAFQSSTNRYGETTVPRQNDARRPEKDGAHVHVIDERSGDRETRPVNASVNWIIKATER